MAQNQDDAKYKEISRDMNYPSQHHQLSSTTTSSSSTGTLSIATPAVTTILPMTENMTDSCFMLPAASYSQDTYNHSIAPTNEPAGLGHQSNCKPEKDFVVMEHNNMISSGAQPPSHYIIDHPKQSEQSSSGNFHYVEMKPAVEDNVKTSTTINNQISSIQGSNQEHEGVQQHNNSFEDAGSPTKMSKKRNKIAKKNTKLDAKSKLEKSRQSARECRARKKLRYQYLEDLVCNREKAVVKLRDELTMFCELSKQIDVGSISDREAKLMVDQTKENSRSESTSIL